GGPYSVGEVTDRLINRIRMLKRSPAIRFTRPAVMAAEAEAAGAPSASAVASWKRANGLIAIGASTGGTQAIEAVLTRLPGDAPPIVIVQHMPAGFTHAFAQRLNGVCPMRVVESVGGETLERVCAYIAPGDKHLLVDRFG